MQPPLDRFTEGMRLDLSTPSGWQQAIELTNPASLLVVVGLRLGQLSATVAPEDLLQDAMMHAWRARASVRWLGPKPFRCWMLTIIDRCIADARDQHMTAKRGAGRTVPFPACGNGFAGFEPAMSTTPSRVASLKEQSLAMRRALDELPDEVRDPIRLRVFEQESMPRIAERLNLPLSTVQHRIRRGALMYQSLLRSILAQSAIAAPHLQPVAVPRKE